MNSFKPVELKCVVSDEQKITKIEDNRNPVVTDFSYVNIKSLHQDSQFFSSQQSFEVSQAKQVALKKKSHFVINPLLKELLSLGEQEQKNINQQVQEKLRILSEAAEKKGYSKGYVDGLEVGKTEALSSAKDEILERLAKIDDLIHEILSAQVSIYQQNEEFLVGLVFKISKMILLREIQLDKQFVLSLIKNLLMKLEVKEFVKIKINQKDYDLIESFKNDLMGESKSFHLEASDLIQSGGCEIETQWNVIRVDVEKQLGLIAQALGQTQSCSG